jgi:hypothetical protein
MGGAPASGSRHIDKALAGLAVSLRTPSWMDSKASPRVKDTQSDMSAPPRCLCCQARCRRTHLHAEKGLQPEPSAHERPLSQLGGLCPCHCRHLKRGSLRGRFNHACKHPPPAAASGASSPLLVTSVPTATLRIPRSGLSISSPMRPPERSPSGLARCRIPPPSAPARRAAPNAASELRSGVPLPAEARLRAALTQKEFRTNASSGVRRPNGRRRVRSVGAFSPR